MQIVGYKLDSELGRGTTGIVYKATSESIGILVAIKVLTLNPAEPEGPARFMREARLLASLDVLSGVPAMYEVAEGPLPRCYYIVREYVAGDSLERLIRERNIDLFAGLKAIASIANTVQHLHERGISHRNLAPSNVLITPQGNTKLIGFGRSGHLASSDFPGGSSPDIDMAGLANLLKWLFHSVGQPIPSVLQDINGSAAQPGDFEKAILQYLRQSASSTGS